MLFFYCYDSYLKVPHQSLHIFRIVSHKDLVFYLLITREILIINLFNYAFRMFLGHRIQKLHINLLKKQISQIKSLFNIAQLQP